MTWKPILRRLLLSIFDDVKELIMVSQSITDALTRLTAAVAAVDAKVDALIAAQAGSATVAEQDALAAQVDTASAALEATAQKA